MKNIFKFLLALSLIVVYKPIFSQTPIPYLKLNGKYIYVDSATMEPVINKEFDFAYRFYDSLAWIVMNNKLGLINLTGKEIISPKYYRIKSFYSPETVSCEWRHKDGKISIREGDKEEYDGMIPYLRSNFFYDGIACVADSLNKWAIIDKKGRELTQFVYDNFSCPEFSILRATRKDLGMGLVNLFGKEILKPQNNQYLYFSEGIAKLEKNGKVGYIDTTGKLILPYKNYNGSVSDFKNGIAIIRLLYKDGKSIYEDGKWLLLDKKGKEIVITGYHNIKQSGNGLIIYSKKFSAGSNQTTSLIYGLLDHSGKEICQKPYKAINYYYKASASIVIDINNRYGFLDNKGNEIIPCIYDEITEYEGVFKAKLNDQIVFLDHGLKELFRSNKKNPRIKAWEKNKVIFSNGFAKCWPHEKENIEKCGIIDNNGKFVLQPIYDNIDDLINGYSWINLNNKYGLVDSLGNIILPTNYEFDYVYPVLNSGLAIVNKNSEWYFINSKAEKIKALSNVNIFTDDRGKKYYDLSFNFENGFSWVKDSKGQYFLLSENGKEFRQN